MKKLYIAVLLVLPFISFGQVVPITSTEPIDLSGYAGATNDAGQGEYEIFLGNDNMLDKPIFLIDGFDPGDTRDIQTIYNSLNYTGNPNFNNLGDEIRAEGYDVVILNFPGAGGADFIERNAMVLVELINTINGAKTASAEPNIIIGPSMGGLISRYALNYMEANMQDADTRLWISFDAPHLGANVPIGLQHQFNYLANNTFNPIAEVQPIVDDVLLSPAAKQLLVDHFEAHLIGGTGVDFDPALTLPLSNVFRDEFEANINSLTTSGFPENVRKVSVVNGSGIGNSYLAKDGVTEVIPGFSIVSTNIPIPDVPFVGTVDVTININMTPIAGASQQVSQFRATAFGGIVEVANAAANSGTTNFDGVDAAPGGLFDLSGFTGSIPATGIAADFLNALTIDQFSFIPTVSALALEITPETSGDSVNWFHDINISNTRATTDNTPFDNTFLPDDNEGHVALTQANVTFMLDEIRGTTLGIAEENYFAFQLEKNPVKDELVLLSNKATNASISIIDVTGKIVFNTKTELNNRNTIPVNLEQGFYILSVISDDNSRFTTKFLAN